MNIQQPFLPSTLFPKGALGLRSAGADTAVRAATTLPVNTLPTAAQAFSAVLELSQHTPQPQPNTAGQVKSGDTLLGIVRDQAAQRGLGLSGSQSMRLVQQLARDSGIANANRIFPGQPLALGGVHSRLSAMTGGEAREPLIKQGEAAAALSRSGATGAAASLTSTALPPVPAARVLGSVTASAPVLSPRTAAQRLGSAAYGVVSAAQTPTVGTTAAMPLSVPDFTSVTALTTTAGGGTAGDFPAATPALTPTPSAAAKMMTSSLAETVESTAPLAPASLAAATSMIGKTLAGPHPVLEQTLDRAVARGFIPAIERGDVYDKIIQLSARYRFKPDDFARLTLIESDGMNPRASNERCHGIIQFCDGNDRGAATAGFAANPRAILGFSVYQQLHLVDRYFAEVGIKPGGTGQASLDELYLAVLMPAARNTTDPQAPLGIPGTQASVLHPGRDRSAPITRQSILDGLQQHASERLSGYGPRARPQVVSNELAGRLR